MGAILKRAHINEIEDGAILVDNPDGAGNEKTYLNGNHAAGVTTLTLIDSTGIVANDYILIGKIGDEKTEIAKVLTVPGATSVTVAAISFAHTGDTPVVLLGANQIKIYSAAAKDGAYSLVATANIEPSEFSTTYVDAAWATTKYYKATIYNSTTATESPYSGQVAATGYSNYSRRKIADRILAVCRDEFGAAFPRDDVNDWVNEAHEFFQNTIISLDEEYSLTDTGAITPGAMESALPNGWRRMKRLWVSPDGVNYYIAKRTRGTDIGPNATFNSLQPVYYLKGDNIGIPSWAANTTYKMLYYANPTLMTDDADELPSVLQSFTRAYVDFGLFRSAQAEGKIAKGAMLPNSVLDEDARLRREVGQRMADYPEVIADMEGVYSSLLEDEADGY